MFLHREVMRTNKQVDHINRNGLDNRKDNLRIVEPWQNGQNRQGGKRNTTGVKGVSFDSRRGKFCVDIMVNGVRHRSRFDDLKEAEACARENRERLAGEFACHTACDNPQNKEKNHGI